MSKKLLFNSSKNELEDGFTNKDNPKYFKKVNLFNELQKESEKKIARNNLGITDLLKYSGVSIESIEDATIPGIYFIKDGSILLFKRQNNSCYQLLLQGDSIKKREQRNDYWGNWVNFASSSQDVQINEDEELLQILDSKSRVTDDGTLLLFQAATVYNQTLYL